MSPSLTAAAPLKIAGPALYAYQAMGGVLHSELELPELVAARSQAPDWTFRIGRGEPPEYELNPLGERQLGLEVYRLFEIPTGFRLEYSHAGTFDITGQGSSITWYRSADHSIELARCILLGPALAIALETAGLFCLHGSAVAVGNQAIAFIGGKHHGKSTLAMALTAAGARLISDDIVPLVPGAPTMARPGVPSARLWDDSAEQLAVGRYAGRLLPGIKSTLTAFAETVLQLEPLPIAAIYRLQPNVNGTLEVPCLRTRLSGADALVMLAQQAKLPDPLVGTRRAGARLAAAATIAANVPICTLRFVGGFARLHEVVEQLLSWHSDPAAAIARQA